MNSLTKSRVAFLAIVAAFIIPVIVAKLVLDNHWYQGAVTNKGQMLTPPIELGEALQALPAEYQQKWQVGLLIDNECAAACQQALYAMNQLDVALGRESDRVVAMVYSLTSNKIDLTDTPVVQQVSNDELTQALHSKLASLPGQQLFLVDPLGNVVMYYPIHADEQTMRKEAKNVLADLRNLLKLSKIG